MRIALAALLVLTGTLAHAEHYGAPITMQDPVTLERAVAKLDAAPTAEVLIESTVDKVCKMEGCWLGLKSASSALHVTFKDHSFFVPQTLIGKTVVVQGQLSKVTMTLAETQHYVKDAGGDPATVTQPRVRYELVASGVAVKT
jgi:Domain of unknown function (DUF4920)